jgi:hypothetical protein
MNNEEWRTPDPEPRVPDPEHGSALIVAIMAMLLMLAAGSALVLLAVTETRISASYRVGAGALYASEAALERALMDLGALADWDAALQGRAASTFTGAPPGGLVDLDEETAVLRCGRRAVCSDADITAFAAERPWGANNPRWQLYAWGPLSQLDVGVGPPQVYLAVWVADDPGETDGDALRDGSDEDNPGRGILTLTAVAFGPGGARRVTEATIARRSDPSGPGVGSGLHVVSWREVR